MHDAHFEMEVSSGGATEDWIRLPKPKARCFGLSRTSLLELCETGAVRSVVLRKRHALRGIRLIYLPSLLQLFERNATGGTETESL